MTAWISGQEVGWIVLAVVGWIAVVAAAVGVGIHYVRSSRRPLRHTLTPSPLEVLERRYAAGEIDRRRFEEAAARLREHELDR